MYCPNCGVKLAKEGKYCQSCGHLVSRQEHNDTVSPKIHISEEDEAYRETADNNTSYLMNEAKKTAGGIIKQGVLWLVAGVIITELGYTFAEPGGTYYIFWGLMIYGGYKLLQGIYYSMRPQALIDKALENIKKESEKSPSESAKSEDTSKTEISKITPLGWVVIIFVIGIFVVVFLASL